MTPYERSLYEKYIHELETDRDKLLEMLKQLLNEKLTEKLAFSKTEKLLLS